MENIIKRSVIQDLANNIDLTQFNHTVDTFLSDLEGPAKQSFNKLVDSGLSAIRSGLGVGKRRTYTRTLVAAAALGAVGYLVFRNLDKTALKRKI